MIKTYADYDNLQRDKILQNQVDDWIANGGVIKQIEQKIGNLTVIQAADKLVKIINRRGAIKSQELFNIVGVHSVNKVLKRVYTRYAITIRQEPNGLWSKVNDKKKTRAK